ncbi:restriction endonuclease subunit S [Corynebacterium tuberculostearicum]|uniref:restriction endonuclease subunit S n=1 Tax=Corynebacterium tuberculostearicum TaxID=38304 RepID=UPI002542FB26|nr:restriction endonuclease subunit S [Corynebacterium tuberculostearicum]MDK4231016.1 restriction endonuclease subunit S [Corynebacterium tuberculostearicum]
MKKIVSLKEVCESDYGVTASATEHPTGTHFLRITDIVNFTDYSGVPFVDIDDEDRRKKLLKQNDIVVARTGATVGASHLFRGTEPTVFASYLVRFRTKTPDVDPVFVSYVLNSPAWKQFIFANAHSKSAQPNLSAAAMMDFQFSLPEIREQQKIASVLKALDDKISTNVRIVNATDSLIDVLYSRVSKMLTEQSFAKVVQVFGGSTPSTKNDAFWDGDINWATPTDITTLDGPWIGDTSRKITEAGLASMSSSLHPENSILLTSRATIGAIALASGPIATNQGFIVVEAPDELTPWLFAQMKVRKREFEAWANGATFMELSRGNFKKLPFIGCSDDDLQAFNDAAWPLLKRAQTAQKENQVLARTRDELLPLLMSGRITVGEAQETADAADEATSES